jgi:hypothetical protein
MATLTTKVKIDGSLATVRDLEKRVKRAMDSWIFLCQTDYEMCTFGWKHSPKFVRRKAAKMGGIVRAVVGTNDRNFSRINDGTSGVVRARKARFLSFRPGYVARTRPGMLKSGSHARYGKPIVRRQVRREIKPRRFTETIWANRVPELPDLVYRELTRK